MSEFYIYGFRRRGEYTTQSVRSYDNERRRIESWLGDYMGFKQTANGKNVFLSIDSRACRHNPFYRALKSKSFTDGDITLHFVLLDIMHDSNEHFTLSELCDRINSEYLAGFSEPMTFDDSTIRKKLKEYAQRGLIAITKEGRAVKYSRMPDVDLSSWKDALEFYSEEGLLGVIGSFISDKLNMPEECFVFKHHYITQTLDSEIICELLKAMHQKSCVKADIYIRHKRECLTSEIIPLKILISTQSGRNYLIAYSDKQKMIVSFRLDFIFKVEATEPCKYYDALRERANEMQKHSWGIIPQKRRRSLEHVEFTVRFLDYEQFIFRRLEREKRCGTVTLLDKNNAKFSADVYDISEMIPWIRTFICRITSLSMSDKKLESRFKNDIRLMYKMYGIKPNEEEIGDDIQ